MPRHEDTPCSMKSDIDVSCGNGDASDPSRGATTTPIIYNNTKELLDILKKEGYCLKFVASSKIEGNKVDLSVEPTALDSTNVISMTNNEFNIVSVDCSYNGELMFYGKGAGRYPTANAIVNDILMIYDGNKNYTFDNQKLLDVEYLNDENEYYMRIKEDQKISSEIIKKQDGNKMITKKITRSLFLELLSKIDFYGKIL